MATSYETNWWKIIMLLILLVGVVSLNILQSNSVEMKKVNLNGEYKITSGFALQDLSTSEIYASKDSNFVKCEDNNC